VGGDNALAGGGRGSLQQKTLPFEKGRRGVMTPPPRPQLLCMVGPPCMEGSSSNLYPKNQ